MSGNVCKFRERGGRGGILAGWAKSGVGASEGCNLFLLQAPSLPCAIQGDDDRRRPLAQEIHATSVKVLLKLLPNLATDSNI